MVGAPAGQVDGIRGSIPTISRSLGFSASGEGGAVRPLDATWITGIGLAVCLACEEMAVVRAIRSKQTRVTGSSHSGS